MATTVRELLSLGSARILAGKDGSSAWLDSSLLWAHIQNISRDKVLANLSTSLLDADASLVEEFLALCDRRASGYPIAYVLGVKEFFGRNFKVDESVLIPRPETELLVEWILETVTDCPWSEQLTILDCCTGSGCIPITIGLEMEHRRLLCSIAACDLSADALVVAQNNREVLWPHGSMPLYHGDLLEALPPHIDRFDLIISNPPYVPRIEAMASEKKGWCEPLMALDGGADGLDLIRRLIAQSAIHLKPGGWLFMEFGDGQSEAIVDILESYDFRSTEIRCDLAGLPRMVRSKSGE